MANGRVFLKTSINDERKLSASKNDLGAILLFLKLFQKNDEIFNYLITFIASFDAINDALKQILVFVRWNDWLDITSGETILEKTSSDTTAAAKNSALSCSTESLNVLSYSIRCDIDHA